MRVTYHIGLHCTDEDRALACLLANAERLSASGHAIARPGLFRPALREAMLALKGAPATAEMQMRLRDAVTDLARPDYILFSSDSFLCVPQRAIQGDRLYPLVGERAPWIRNLFPDDAAHFALALRNPATFIPALHARFSQKEPFEAFLARIEPEALSWADMVARLQRAVPDARLTIWCNEDSALLWPDLLALLAGTDDASDFAEADAFLAELMSEDGLRRMHTYLTEHPPSDAGHRRRITAAFLDRFARPEAVEESFDLPGWTDARIAALTARYEADIAAIAAMPGIDVLQP